MTAPAVTERAAELRGSRTPYVHARVVLAERPTSAKPGDEAIVLGDGTIEGFVGGSCAETTVRAHSLALLASGQSLLLRITPAPELAQPGKTTVVNECLSGGTFEVFLEPVLPAPVVAVLGESPIARALTAMGPAAGFAVQQYDSVAGLSGASALVIASHGRDDEQSALAAAVAADVPYVALVASRRRAAGVLAGLDDEVAARVHAPAGLDIGAHTAPEVAVSILAEIIQTRSATSGSPASGDEEEASSTAHLDPSGTALDPVCGMTVATVESSLHLDVDGGRWWFCGKGCQHAFAADPAAYAATGTGT